MWFTMTKKQNGNKAKSATILKTEQLRFWNFDPQQIQYGKNEKTKRNHV